MDSSTQKDNSPEAIRERVESKQDEFAGGSEPGWQTLEATVDDTRHQAAQEWSSEGGAAASSSQSTTSTFGTSDAQMAQPVSTGGESQDVTVRQGNYSTMTGGEAGSSAGQSSQTLGTESASPTATSPAGGSSTEAETPPFNDEHPLGVGQQCYKCGAYNDIEAETCWNCSEKLTPAMVETPGLTEGVEGANTGGTSDSMSTDATSETDAGGARPIPSD